jgi:hypothetical protein
MIPNLDICWSAFLKTGVKRMCFRTRCTARGGRPTCMLASLHSFAFNLLLPFFTFMSILLHRHFSAILQAHIPVPIHKIIMLKDKETRSIFFLFHHQNFRLLSKAPIVYYVLHNVPKDSFVVAIHYISTFDPSSWAQS